MLRPIERRLAPEPIAAPHALPRFAEKANDLEAIKKAVDEAAAVGGGIWLAYVFLLVYLAVAAGAVAHGDLLGEKSVKLPFAGVELPLVAFFILAPLIFVVVHAYTLVHLVLLTDKAKRFHQALDDQIPIINGMADGERDRRAALRAGLRRQLPSRIFVQFLAGPYDIRVGPFGWLLRALSWIVLVAAPAMLILMMQIESLPYHRSLVTWTQRVALGLDLLLIWWLWGKILSGREYFGEPRRLIAWLWPPLGLALALAALLFSVAVVTFPGEWQEERLPSLAILPAIDAPRAPGKESNGDSAVSARKVTLHDWLFGEQVDETGRRDRWPAVPAYSP
jgi:hypothetical protein